MTSYQRVRAAIDRKPADRAPRDFLAEPVIWQRLEQHFATTNRDEILDHFGVDRRCVGPKYIGPALQTFPDGSYEIIVSGGPRQKMTQTTDGQWIEATVFYPWEQVQEPQDLEEKWGWNGKKEWWDFSAVGQSIDDLEQRGDYWIAAHGDPSGLQHICMWAGDENFLMALAADPELAVAMIQKHNEIRLWHALKTLEAGQGRIHELHGGGDYGSQTSLLISQEMFRKYFKPLYQEFYKQIKDNFDVEIFFHSCGAIAPLIPDFIEMGVTILDPIQTSAMGMDPEILKQEFGKQLCFHGGMDVQSFLPFATPDQVRQKVQEMVSVLGKDGGYILAPSHNVQPDTSLENIFALYGFLP